MLQLFDVPDQFYMHVYNHALFADEERLNDEQRCYKCHWEGRFKLGIRLHYDVNLFTLTV